MSSVVSQSDLLRERVEQHKPKNVNSKLDDRSVYQAMQQVIEYLQGRFKLETDFPDIDIVFEKDIKVEYMVDFISQNGSRREFDFSFIGRKIKPDGGVLFLIQKGATDKKPSKKPILIAEVKRQGTNDKRRQEGKARQATGNAIERLGKNLTGIRAMMNHESITPFVCFGSGCDFAESEKTVLSKVSMLNEFYPLNKTYVYKRDGSADKNDYAPVSMYFREENWSTEEMFDIMKEIAETAFRYYIY